MIVDTLLPYSKEDRKSVWKASFLLRDISGCMLSFADNFVRKKRTWFMAFWRWFRWYVASDTQPLIELRNFPLRISVALSESMHCHRLTHLQQVPHDQFVGDTLWQSWNRADSQSLEEEGRVNNITWKGSREHSVLTLQHIALNVEPSSGSHKSSQQVVAKTAITQRNTSQSSQSPLSIQGSPRRVDVLKDHLIIPRLLNLDNLSNLKSCENVFLNYIFIILKTKNQLRLHFSNSFSKFYGDFKWLKHQTYLEFLPKLHLKNMWQRLSNFTANNLFCLLVHSSKPLSWF